MSGLAALLKQRFPDLTPAQIINRITATARHPGGGVDNHVGAGVIDPVAALTWDVPPSRKTVPYRVKQLPPPGTCQPPDRGPITWVVVTGGSRHSGPRTRRAGPTRPGAPMKNILAQFGLRFTTGHARCGRRR